MKYGLVAVSETLLRENDDDVLLIGGSDFYVYRCERASVKSRGGGVAVFARNLAGLVIVDARNFPSGCAFLCVDFIANFNFAFTVIYRPPGCPVLETKLFRILFSTGY